MGSGKPLPYMNGWIVFFLSFTVLYLLAKTGSIMAIPNTAFTIATLFPAPFNGFLSTGIAVLALFLTAGVKLLDAPVGSGSRFRSLRGKLSKNPKIRNPSAVAATIGRNKYGASRFQRLSRKRRS